jgi:hypothetical protein
VTIAILSVFEQLTPAAALADDELAATAGTAPSVTAVIAETAAALAIAETLDIDLEILMNHSFVEERDGARELLTLARGVLMVSGTPPGCRPCACLRRVRRSSRACR